MRLAACLLAVSLLAASAPTASAHPVKRVSARSICHYEERYFVWTAGEKWRVWGRLKPGHGNARVVLQKSKYGRNWLRWKTAQTNANGRYRFTGTATNKNGWWINLRVVFRSQKGHNRRVSLPMYIDTNPSTAC